MVLAILRAESLSEVPVIGRMIAASERRAHAEADGSDGDEASGASLLPDPEHCTPTGAPEHRDVPVAPVAPGATAERG